MQQGAVNIPNIGGMYNRGPHNVVNNSPQNQINDLHPVRADDGIKLNDIPSVLQQAPNPNAPQKPPIDNNITDIDKQNQIIGLVERWGQVLNSTQIEQGMAEKLLLGPTSTNHLSTMFKLDFAEINNSLTENEQLNEKEINDIKTQLQSLDTPTGQPKVDLNKGEVPLWAIEQLGADLIKEGKIKESNFLLKAYEKNIKLNADKDKIIAYVKSFIGYGLTIAGFVALFVGGTWTLALTLIGVGFSVMAIVGICQKLYDRSKTKGEKKLASELQGVLDTLKNTAGQTRENIKQTLQNKIDEGKMLQQQNQQIQQNNKNALTEKDAQHKEEIDKLNAIMEKSKKEKDELQNQLQLLKKKLNNEQKSEENESNNRQSITENESNNRQSITENESNSKENTLKSVRNKKILKSDSQLFKPKSLKLNPKSLNFNNRSSPDKKSKNVSNKKKTIKKIKKPIHNNRMSEENKLGSFSKRNNYSKKLLKITDNGDHRNVDTQLARHNLKNVSEVILNDYK